MCIRDRLFATINLFISENFASILSFIVVTLLLTFLVTSADSGILIINTLASGGDGDHKRGKHIIVWGIIFSALIGTLLYAGGMDALRSVMIIGALPFSLVMLFMTIALIKTFLKGRSL